MRRREMPGALGSLGLTVCVAIAVLGCLWQLRDASASPPDQELVDTGRALYIPGCSSCHGLDARGRGSSPSLVGVGAASADFQLSTGRMPLPEVDAQPSRQDPVYSPEEIRALVAYVASLGGGPAIPVVDTDRADLPSGGELYRANCASCHNSSGIGGALSYGRAAPNLVKSTATQVVEAMRTGPGQMPVFSAENLDDGSAAAIAKYVTFLRDPGSPGGFALGRVGPVGEGFVALVVGIGGIVAMARWIVGRSSE